MNSDGFFEICKKFLSEGDRARTNGYLGSEVEKGHHAVTRVDLDGDKSLEHAILIDKAEYNTETKLYEFDYWDPVTEERGHVDNGKIGDA